MASRLFQGGPLHGQWRDVPDNAYEYVGYEEPQWSVDQYPTPVSRAPRIHTYVRKPNRLSIDPPEVFVPYGTKIGDKIRTAIPMSKDVVTYLSDAKGLARRLAEKAMERECAEHGVGHSPILLMWYGSWGDSRQWDVLFEDNMAFADMVLYVFEAVATPLEESCG